MNFANPPSTGATAPDSDLKPEIPQVKSLPPRPVVRRRDLQVIADEVQTRFPKIMARLAE